MVLGYYRRFFGKVNSRCRGVICLNFVLPLRIAAFALLGGNWVYIILNLDSIDLITTFITLLILVLSWTLLKECRRSIAYHKEIETLEGRDITKSTSDIE